MSTVVSEVMGTESTESASPVVSFAIFLSAVASSAGVSSKVVSFSMASCGVLSYRVVTFAESSSAGNGNENALFS